MSTNYFEYYQQQTLSTPVSNGVEWFWETCDFSQLVISPPSSPEPIPAPGQGLYPTHHSSFTLPYLPTPPESPTNYSSFPLPNYLPLHRSSTPPPVAAQHNSYPQAQYTPYNPANAFLPPSPTLVPLNTPPPSSHLETSSLRNFERRDVDAVDADKNSLGVQGIPSTPTSTVTTLSDGLRISEITFPWNVTSPWYVGSPSIATYSDNDSSSSSSMDGDVDPYFGPDAHRRPLPFIRKLRGILANPMYADLVRWDDEGTTVIGKLLSLCGLATAGVVMELKLIDLPSFTVKNTSRRLVEKLLPRFFRAFFSCPPSCLLPASDQVISPPRTQTTTKFPPSIVYGFRRLHPRVVRNKLDYDSTGRKPAGYVGWYHPSFSRSGYEWMHMRPKPSQSRRAAALERERLAAEEDGGAVVRGRSLARTRRVVEVYRAMRR